MQLTSRMNKPSGEDAINLLAQFLQNYLGFSGKNGLCVVCGDRRRISEAIVSVLGCVNA